VQLSYGVRERHRDLLEQALAIFSDARIVDKHAELSVNKKEAERWLRDYAETCTLRTMQALAKIALRAGTPVRRK